MKLARLARRLGDLLLAERRRRRARLAKLQDLLAKMKREQAALEQALSAEHDPARRAGLELEQQILHEQLRKGARLRRTLRRKD